MCAVSAYTIVAIKRVSSVSTVGNARVCEGLGHRDGAERQSERPEPRRTLARQWQAMGRIEHPLLDRGRSSTPSDLRPSLATTLYHIKLQMFLFATKGPGHPPKDTPTLVVLMAAGLIGVGAKRRPRQARCG